AARARAGTGRARPATARGATARRSPSRRPAARGGTGMTAVLISGGLTFAVGLLILGPFSITGRLRERAHTRDDIRLRELLRQLRDLDDDLAAGKLTAEDHDRFRGVVEREAAALMDRTSGPQPDRTAPSQEGDAGARPVTGPVTSAAPRGCGTRSRTSRW